jgi:ABC-2 type transport system permease protein
VNATLEKLYGGLHVVWTIAAKDIVDAIRNKVVLALILGLSLMLLAPKVLGLALDPPATRVVVYDAGRSSLVDALQESPQFAVRRARTVDELEQAVGNAASGPGREMGLVLPAGFDLSSASGEQLPIDGYVAWANRIRSQRIQSDMEGQLAALWGRPVRVRIDGNVAYPSGTGRGLGMMVNAAVIVTAMMGITIVPNLLFEEKQTRTMDALLVSPATIGQVVAGKALAGLFYVLVTAGVVLLIHWSGVVHWELAILFALAIGMFSTAVGLVLGSFFSAQQEVTGWTSLIVVALAGAVFVDLVGLQVPAFVRAFLPWVPSVSLAAVLRMSFLERAAWPQVWGNLGSTVALSLPLYALVIWRVRRSDR